MVYIATDHNGFDIKKRIIEHFKDAGIIFQDLGPYEFNSEDDYPLFAFELCEAVLEAKENKGILICGTGGGMCIAANKVKGIRAAEAESEAEAELIRKDNDANVLVLSKLEFDQNRINSVIDTWLRTPFSDAERHKRRLDLITEYENGKLISTPEPIINDGNTSSPTV